MNLDEIRVEIDAVDAALTALFEKRMALVKQVAEFKKANGVALTDASREAAVLEKNRERLSDPALGVYLDDLFRQLIHLSKLYQQSLNP
ncbi:MAG: chorismate mutase [Erysipelotrichaceae bacterium]|jgi:monofunctional chorismate mutase|nr:chorismate mutase [Erysipelotrichaceae bacterium]